MKKTSRLIVTTCGTSLLTNDSGELRQQLIQCANAVSEDQIDTNTLILINNHIRKRKTELLSADNQTLSRLSAEMNCILKYCQSDNFSQDMHMLIATDTWLGRRTAELLSDILIRKGAQAQTVPITGLRTNTLPDFQVALSDLVKWCDDTVKSYRKSHFKITFNLTGGFKGVQGFMQTLAMLYADETTYLFEGSPELLTIPRLPIKMDAEQTIQENLHAFRRLAKGLPIQEVTLTAIPEVFLLSFDNEVGLSPWGEVAWRQHSPAIYKQAMFEAPSDKIRFGKGFQNSIKSLPAHRLSDLNHKLDDLAQCLEQGVNVSSLDFKKLNRSYSGSDYELDAWHNEDARRVFAHFEGKVLVLDRLDKGLGH